MAKESVLTTKEKNNIDIKYFIFHIIISDDDNPSYLEKVVLQEEQKKFFKNRLVEASTGTQYIFKEKETSDIYAHCQKIAEDPEKNFIEYSKRITASFHGHHKGNATDGVFIISMVEIEKGIDLIFLIKMDQNQVLQYKVEKSVATMEKILNSFVEDKKAMQKVAVIDVFDKYNWDVLASDRVKTEGIADYFKNFLTVIEKDDASVLTRKTVIAVRQWAISNKNLLPSDQDVSDYKSRSIDYMKTHDVFDTDEFIKMVIYDKDSKSKKTQIDSLQAFLEQQEIAGQSFSPKPNSLASREKKNVRETLEGVKIEWEGTPESKRMSISTKDGTSQILIKTNNLKNIS